MQARPGNAVQTGECRPNREVEASQLLTLNAEIAMFMTSKPPACDTICMFASPGCSRDS